MISSTIITDKCLVKVKKTLQKPCTNNLAQRRIQKDRDQSKYIKLKTLQSRRLLQGLIKQREIELGCDISTGQSKYRNLTLFHVV